MKASLGVIVAIGLGCCITACGSDSADNAGQSAPPRNTLADVASGSTASDQTDYRASSDPLRLVLGLPAGQAEATDIQIAMFQAALSECMYDHGFVYEAAVPGDLAAESRNNAILSEMPEQQRERYVSTLYGIGGTSGTCFEAANERVYAPMAFPDQIADAFEQAKECTEDCPLPPPGFEGDVTEWRAKLLFVENNLPKLEQFAAELENLR